MSLSYSRLKREVEKYTRFTCGSYQIDIPYGFACKNTPELIYDFLQRKAGGSFGNVTERELQSIADKYGEDRVYGEGSGVDCSGFVYYCLNEASGGDLKAAVGGYSYRHGVNAQSLTSSTYASGRTFGRAQDVTLGATIYTYANQPHVLVVTDVIYNSSGLVTKIKYAHSNGSHGPHEAYIEIGNPFMDLDASEQKWVDVAYSDSSAKRYYRHIFKFDCL